MAEYYFEDYPVKTWKNPNAGEAKVAFGAKITDWSFMVGHGETTEIAIENLKKKFKLYKDNNKDLPSPGTKVPLRFESTDNIDQFKDIAVDFFKTVLSMDYNEGFYSDGSNLSLLEPLDEEQAKNARGQIIRRTIMRYGIDISSIYDGPLYAIFKAIRDKYK